MHSPNIDIFMLAYNLTAKSGTVQSEHHALYCIGYVLLSSHGEKKTKQDPGVHSRELQKVLNLILCSVDTN